MDSDTNIGSEKTKGVQTTKEPLGAQDCNITDHRHSNYGTGKLASFVALNFTNLQNKQHAHAIWEYS